MKQVILKGGMFAIVDCEDFAKVSRHKWYLESNGYVRSRIGGKLISMHRFLLGLKTGEKIDVDHINGCRTDNRRANLRVCDRAQNLANLRLSAKNMSGFKGVSWSKARGKWQAKIRTRGKQVHLGFFDDASVAHSAYCAAAQSFKGEFANFGMGSTAAPGEWQP